MAKIISIYGIGGKTILATYLAMYLARDKKVCAIYGDKLPLLPRIAPNIPVNKSLGELLSLAKINEFNILEYLVVTKAFPNLAFLSYKKGDEIESYQYIVDGNLNELYSTLDNIVDFIIVVSPSTPNVISRFFNPISDIIIKTFPANTKGVVYHQSTVSEGDVNVLVNNSPYNSILDIQEAIYSKKVPVIPYCKELEKVYNGYDITFSGIPKKYNDFLVNLIKENNIC